MFNSSITQALAEARVADLQRASTQRTATVPPRRHRLRSLALLGLAATAALAPISADAKPAQSHTIAEPTQSVTSRYFDIEANKAASLSTLGRHIAHRRADRSSRYQDIEANKARSRLAR